MFHGLERFSEDLDFSLLAGDASFNLAEYLPTVRDELGAWGFDMTVETRRRNRDSAVQSAFIRDSRGLELWSADFFTAVSREKLRLLS